MMMLVLALIQNLSHGNPELPCPSKSMKFIFLALALITPAFSASFDSEAFGKRLNGWQKNHTASYQLTDTNYRTYKPSITKASEGGLALSTQVDLVMFGGKAALSHIDMSFSADGTLLSAQLRSSIGSKTIDTGMIKRPEAPAKVEGETAPVKFNGTEQLLTELFNRFHGELAQITEDKNSEKRDLLSRLFRSKSKIANLEVGLRYNCDLILQHVSR
jgi:hypothetical protein